jgi:hypothetical protein
MEVLTKENVAQSWFILHLNEPGDLVRIEDAGDCSEVGSQ